ERLVDTQIELLEIGHARRVLRTERGLVRVVARVVEGADHGRAWKAAHPTEARAERPRADSLARDDREHVRLVVVEETPRAVADVAALAAAQRVREPAEETARELLANDEQNAVASSLAVLHESAREQRRGNAAAYGEIAERLVEGGRLDRQRAAHGERLADRR